MYKIRYQKKPQMNMNTNQI